MVMWPLTPSMRATSSVWNPLITEVTTISVATPSAMPTSEKIAMIETNRSPRAGAQIAAGDGALERSEHSTDASGSARVDAELLRARRWRAA